MPTATEHDQLPYESARHPDDIARRVAELEALDARFVSRRKWGGRFAIVAAIAYVAFFFLPFDPGYTSLLFMGYFGAALVTLAITVKSKVNILVGLMLLLAFSMGILIAIRPRKRPKQKKAHD